MRGSFKVYATIPEQSYAERAASTALLLVIPTHARSSSAYWRSRKLFRNCGMECKSCVIYSFNLTINPHQLTPIEMGLLICLDDDIMAGSKNSSSSSSNTNWVILFSKSSYCKILLKGNNVVNMDIRFWSHNCSSSVAYEENGLTKVYILEITLWQESREKFEAQGVRFNGLQALLFWSQELELERFFPHQASCSPKYYPNQN